MLDCYKTLPMTYLSQLHIIRSAFNTNCICYTISDGNNTLGYLYPVFGRNEFQKERIPVGNFFL